MYNYLSHVENHIMIHRHVLHDEFDNKHIAQWDDGMHEIKEPIEIEKTRYQLFPIQDPIGYEFYETQVRMFWTPYEFDYSKERESYLKLEAPARRMLAYTLAFFSCSDLIVNDRLWFSIMRDERITAEMSMALTFQASMECIHTQTYSILLDTLISDQSLKNDLFAGAIVYPSIKSKKTWFMENSHPTLPFGHRLLTQLSVEGIHFSSSFALISWLKIHTNGGFPALCGSNALIIRDENMHAQMSVSLLKKFDLIDKKLAKRLLKEATNLEIEFIKEAYARECLGMTCAQMIHHVKFVCNYWCKQLNIDPLYPNVRETFPWIENSTHESRSNFFELKEVNYVKSTDVCQGQITFDEEF